MRAASGSAASECAVSHISPLAICAEARGGLFLISYGDISGNGGALHGLSQRSSGATPYSSLPGLTHYCPD